MAAIFKASYTTPWDTITDSGIVLVTQDMIDDWSRAKV